MAADNKEIEIKIAVTKSVFLKVRNILKQKAEFVKTTTQVDMYYTPAHRNFVAPKYPFEWLSIRERGEKTILNYKHFHPENAEITTHCDEFETEIKDKEQLSKIFMLLNIKELVKVEKHRETYKYNDEFEIALDEVKELGFFIEIEALKHEGSVEKTKKKLFQFAKELGIDISNPDKRGYPYLLLEKKGLLKN